MKKLLFTVALTVSLSLFANAGEIPWPLECNPNDTDCSSTASASQPSDETTPITEILIGQISAVVALIS
jgi:hypothetical protein